MSEDSREPDEAAPGEVEGPSEAELDQLLEKVDREWERETEEEPAPTDTAPGQRASRGRPPTPEEERAPHLTGEQLEGGVEAIWRAGWKKAARARGVDPEEDREFQELLDSSDTEGMAEASAAILDRLLPELATRYPHLTQLVLSTGISAGPLLFYLARQEEGEEGAEEEGREEPIERDRESPAEHEEPDEPASPTEGSYE